MNPVLRSSLDAKECALEKKRRVITVRQKNEDMCPICLESLNLKRLVWLPCGHSMHLKCERALLEKSYLRCPLCRTPNPKSTDLSIFSAESSLLYAIEFVLNNYASID